jgi:hypothetical protein
MVPIHVYSRWLRTLSSFGLLVAMSCSTGLEPRAGVTLLVTNATCQAGQCESVRVLGFPANQPSTPGGFWSLDLGVVAGSEACLTLPPSAVFRVIGQHTDGTADTTSFTWTTAKSISLGALPPSGSRIQAGPSTPGFVPARASGWRTTLPGEAQPTQTTACSSD